MMDKEIEILRTASFDVGPIRPPSEGGSFSLLLRFTRNCPWNMCRFCYGSPYKRKKFEYRKVEDIKKDIDNVRAILEALKTISFKLGFAGELNEVVLNHVLNHLLDPDQMSKIVMVYRWEKAKKESVFIQDADSMIMRTKDLVEALKYLKTVFPDIKRITTYARAKSVKNKSINELKEIFDAGLRRLHIGLESGDDEVLKYVKKGVTSKEHIDAGTKAKEAGYEVSEYIIPGLGGEDRSLEHAKNSAKTLNEIDPHFIRSRPFIPRVGTPMYEDWRKGKFKLLSPHKLLEELKIFVSELNFSGRLCFDHMRNPSYYINGIGYVPLLSQSYEGYKFPEQKDEVLERIDYGLNIEEKRFLKVEDLIEYEKELYGL